LVYEVLLESKYPEIVEEAKRAYHKHTDRQASLRLARRAYRAKYYITESS